MPRSFRRVAARSAFCRAASNLPVSKGTASIRKCSVTQRVPQLLEATSWMARRLLSTSSWIQKIQFGKYFDENCQTKWWEWKAISKQFVFVLSWFTRQGNRTSKLIGAIESFNFEGFSWGWGSLTPSLLRSLCTRSTTVDTKTKGLIREPSRRTCRFNIDLLLHWSL